MTAVASSEALLALLQISDSAFPAGTFAHSFGLEQAVRERGVTGPAEVEAFVRSVLRQTMATAEAPATFSAVRAAAAGDLEGLVAVDRRLHRTRAGEELRDASKATGRRLLDESAMHLDNAFLERYAGAVRAGSSPGGYAAAFGAVAGVMGVDAVSATSALMLSAASAIVQSAMRLLPFSHRNAQAILHKVRPAIAEQAQAIEAARGCLPLRTFHPLQDIYSMRHAQANARMFAS